MVIDFTTVRIASVIAVALAYMLFDLFNKRNVPSLFAYGSMAYGALLTVIYFVDGEYYTMLLSALIGTVVFGLGYVVYRVGQIGLGDITELTSVSLMLPFQSLPLFATVPQFGLPFILSVVIASGVVALIFVPLYYIPKSKSRTVEKGSAAKAAAIGAAYIAFMGFTAFMGIMSVYGIALLAALMFGSVFTTLYETRITVSMVKYLEPNRLEADDMIAMNVMSKTDRAWFRKRSRHFGQLITPVMIRELKAKRVRRKLPVYRQGIPFAFPIFIGVLLSVLFGNLLILAL